MALSAFVQMLETTAVRPSRLRSPPPGPSLKAPMTKDSLIATLACFSFADAVYFITGSHPVPFTVGPTPLDDRLAYPDGHARNLGADAEKDTIIHHDVHRVVLNDPARERVLIGTVCAVVPPADEAPPWYVAVRYM